MFDLNMSANTETNLVFNNMMEKETEPNNIKKPSAETQKRQNDGQDYSTNVKTASKKWYNGTLSESQHEAGTNNQNPLMLQCIEQ